MPARITFLLWLGACGCVWPDTMRGYRVAGEPDVAVNGSFTVELVSAPRSRAPVLFVIPSGTTPAAQVLSHRPGSASAKVTVHEIGRFRQHRLGRLALTGLPGASAARVVCRVSFAGGPRAAPEPAIGEPPAGGSILASLAVNYAACSALGERRTVPGKRRDVSETGDWRLSVEEAGVIRLGYKKLKATGLLGGDDDLVLRANGREVAYRIVDAKGRTRGKLKRGRSLEFYGLPADTEHTGRNVYWLSAEGRRIPRMSSAVPARAKGATTYRSAARTEHFEQDTVYFAAPFTDTAAQSAHYLWERLDAPAWGDYGFTIERLGGDGSAQLSVSLRGRTAGEHHTRILLNGVEVSDEDWSGRLPYRHRATVEPGVLATGSNTLSVVLDGDVADLDQVYVDSFDVEYTGELVAIDESLTFEHAALGDSKLLLSGFADRRVCVLDITDPYRPAAIRKVKVARKPRPDGYRCSFRVRQDEPRRYLAFSAAATRSAELTRDTPSELRATGRGADYLVLAPAEYHGALAPLVAARTAQGLRVTLVDVQDVYDEFSDGLFTPDAIRSFLKWTYDHWESPAPTYVLLVGDAHYDYRRRLGGPDVQTVPTQLFQNQETSCNADDGALACVSGDDYLPDMFVGRFPVRSAAEATTLVQKALTYESLAAVGGQDWAGNALFVADNDVPAFEADSEQLINTYLLGRYRPQRAYLGAYASASAATDAIVQAISDPADGCAVVSYVGHGGTNVWAAERLFSTESGRGRDDVARLTNGPRLPFFSTHSCWDGAFHGFGTDRCLAEDLLLAADGGSIANFSASAVGEGWAQSRLIEQIFDQFFNQGERRLGAATTAARISLIAAGGAGTARMVNLLGDPALEFLLEADQAERGWSRERKERAK